MRAYDNGSFFTVAASRRDVEAFAQTWPCFGPRRALVAEFDKRNGDLVDIRGDEGMDGTGVLALLDDMQAYGAKRIARATGAAS